MMKNPRRILLLIWICFVARGVFYSAIFPIWEPFDEPFHFAYLQQLVQNRSIPTIATPFSRELLESLHVLPLPWKLCQERLPQPFFSHDDYWRLSPAERERLQKQFREIPVAWSREDAVAANLSSYESQQAPLYYLLFYFPLKWMTGFSLASRVLLLRVFNILLASLVVPLGYGVAHSVLKNRSLALSLLALVAALPELFVNVSRVGNESLALVFYTIVFYLALQIVEGPQNFRYFPWLGVTLSLGLLAKAYFLAAIPAFFLVIAWCFWRWQGEGKNLLRKTNLATLALLLIAGPWYWRIHTLTGSWSGHTHEAALRSMSRWQMLAQVPHVNWINAGISVLLSHIWFGGWSFLKFTRPVYFFFGFIILLAALGMGRMALLQFRKGEKANPQAEPGFDKLLVLLSFYAFFWLGLAYDTVVLYIRLGESASSGLYMYSLIVAEAILFYLGLSAVLSRNFRSWILPLLTLLFALLDLSGVHFYLIPYYSGVISHVTQDRVGAASIPQLIRVGIPEFARRLSVNKPAFLGPVEFGVLWMAFLAATVFLIYMTFRLRKAACAEENE